MAGLLAAGSFARPMPLPDTPPILSMRLHAFFRGLPGLWACLNPNCPEVPRRVSWGATGREDLHGPSTLVLRTLWRPGPGAVLMPQMWPALRGRHP